MMTVTRCSACNQVDELDDDGQCVMCGPESAARIEQQLIAILRDGDLDVAQELLEGLRSVGSYQDRGILTTDRGLVIETEGGEYQLTIVRSR